MPMIQIAIKKIVPNPEQPRRDFDVEELEELAQSIREHGVIQPVVVEEAGEFFILHDGERRWRAAKMAGLAEMPAVITPPMNGDGSQKRLMRAMIANIQRKDLSHIEEAQGYARLMEQGMSVGEISRQTGKKESVIYTKMGLLKLEPEIQDLIHNRKLSGHPELCRAMLSIPDSRLRVELAIKAAARNLSIKTILSAASALANGKLKRYEQSPSIEQAVARHGGRPADLPKWDALAQAGMVPPWPAVEQAAKKTCAGCLLRSSASAAICKECPAPQMLLLLMKSVERAKMP